MANRGQNNKYDPEKPYKDNRIKVRPVDKKKMNRAYQEVEARIMKKQVRVVKRGG